MPFIPAEIPPTLTPIRISPPVKGVNSTTPLREMTADYAVALDNVWFDQGQYLTRRPCQKITAGSPTVPSTTSDSIKHLFEHVKLDGGQELFAAVDVSGTFNIYKWTAPNTWGGSVSSFSARPRSAELGGITVVADGVSTSRKYNGSAWSNVASMPLGVTNLGNILHTHKARMCNAGVVGQAGYVFFSDVITDSIYTGTAGGADDWLGGVGGSGGEFIDASAATKGGDVVTGLTSYKGFLVVFMNNHIVFYSGADPSSDFAVAKVITGLGCISQDSIQGIGNDVVFLSQYGFKSLEQIMVQGDAAAKQSSVPINNYVVDVTKATDVEDIRSEFIEELGVYICNMKNVTFVYHIFFDAWTYWYGMQPQVFKRLDGNVITANIYMHYLDKANNGDTVGLGSETAVVMAWELPPIRAADGERKARWNKLELIFEAEEVDSVVVKTYVDVKPSLSRTDILSLTPSEPSATAAGTVMVWGDGTPSANPKTKWGGTPDNDNVWGGLSIIYSGSKKIPLIGRGEFMSAKITNSSITKFRITAVELYSNVGGIR